MTSEFVHLHNHSDYSLLDGAQKIDQLVNTIDDLNMDAVALTEHGNMFSVLPYYKQAKKAGIKPIIGCEIYVAVGSRFEKKTRPEGGWGNNHLILLAQNFTGYRNLMKLVTAGYLEGFYYRPRIDMDLLREYSDGLICMSACLKGVVPEKMLKGDSYYMLLGHKEHQIEQVYLNENVATFLVTILDSDKNYYKFKWQVEKYINQGPLKDCWLTTAVSQPVSLGSSI